jgi:hypothetical protein
MASERLTSCEVAQASSLATVAGSNRAGIVSPYFMPVGRPLDFLCTVFVCFAIIIRVVCTENRIRVDAVTESPKLAE